MVDFVFGIIGQLLYPLFSIIFIILDTLQGLFFSLAGIGEVRVTGEGTGFWNDTITAGNTGTETDTGLIFYLLNTPLVKNMLISIMVLGLFLLIIFTVMAFIKNAYSAKQKGWKEIVGNAIKGLANFVFIPVCCLLGVWLGNILLNAINGATSTGGAQLMSRKLFLAAAYDANMYRNEINDNGEELRDLYAYMKWWGWKGEVPEIESGREPEYYANMVDQVFASGDISIYEWVSVQRGYHLYKINYLTLIIGGIFMMYVMITLAYAMIRRMFILLMLYIISPALCAMYPLDEGKAVGSWKSDFIKQTISAYGAVAGMNIFFSLLPIVDNINFMFWSSSVGDSIIDTIIQLLIMVAGLFVVKELISMISGYIGAEDAYSKGAALRKQAKESVSKYGKKAIKKTSQYAFGAANAMKNSWNKDDKGFGGFLRNVGRSAWGGTKSIAKDAGKDTAQSMLGLDFSRVSGLKDKKGWADMLKNATWAEDFVAGKKSAEQQIERNQKIKELEGFMSEYRELYDMEASSSGKTYHKKNAAATAHDLKKEDRAAQMEELEAIIASYAATLGYGDAGLERVSEETKMPVDVIKKNIESGGALKKARKAWESAERDSANVEDKINTITKDPSSSAAATALNELSRLFGRDLKEIADKLGLMPADLARRLQTGLKVEVNDKKSDGSDRYSEEEKAFGQELNNIIEKHQAKQDRAEDAKKAFLDMAASTKMTDAQGREVKLSESDLEKLASMNARDIAGSGLLDQFDKVSTALAKSGKEQLALLENIRRAISDASKKAEKDKK